MLTVSPVDRTLRWELRSTYAGLVHPGPHTVCAEHHALCRSGVLLVLHWRPLCLLLVRSCFHDLPRVRIVYCSAIGFASNHALERGLLCFSSVCDEYRRGPRRTWNGSLESPSFIDLTLALRSKRCVIALCCLRMACTFLVAW